MTEESCFSEPSVNVALHGILTHKTAIFLAQTWEPKTTFINHCLCSEF